MAKKTKSSSNSESSLPKKLKTSQENEDTAPKKVKLKKQKSKALQLEEIGTSNISQLEDVPKTKKAKKSFEKPTKSGKKNSNDKKVDKNKLFKKTMPEKDLKKSRGKVAAMQEKPEDWNEFKKKKKELKAKRKQSKEGSDALSKAKSFADKIQRKSLDPNERNKLVNQLHVLMKGNYSKFALAHDSSRIVQIALKYGSNIMRTEISKEVMGIVVDMIISKYGRHIVKRLLKHGEPQIRSSVINTMYGNAVKFTSHVISAPTIEYAYSTWATPLQKQHLMQEFFSEMYKNSKDDKVKHLRDVYESSPDLKSGILTAVKDNLSRIINKKLFDSGLVQSVLSQYLTECTPENRAEMISQISPHIVVISNSKDGSKAAMQCIWYGTNKDRKVAMKALKEHIIELCKHEYGHRSVIAFLDTADDTVLLHKILLGEILKHAKNLATNEWGRKVLLWLVAPSDSLYFHPTFIKELEDGRSSATSKKPSEVRRKELLEYASKPLANLVKLEPDFWLSKPSLAVEMLGILKAISGEDLEEAYNSIIGIITNPDWCIKDDGKDIPGIEHPGVHMTLKKLVQHDKVRTENGEPTFGACLAENLSDDVIKQWIQCNRGCFLLVSIFENNPLEVQNTLKEKLEGYAKKLKKQTSSTGAKILLSKLS